MTLKILLADDSMIAQNMGKKILADAGYDVVTVSNGAAAVKKIPETKPDIILLDVYMPGYNGLEVCQLVRSAPETASVPVLLTVGKLEPFSPEEGMRVKADGVIVKPFEATDLTTVVDKLAERLRPVTSAQSAASTRSEAPAETAPLSAFPMEAPPPTLQDAGDVVSAPAFHANPREESEHDAGASPTVPAEPFAQPKSTLDAGLSHFGLDLDIATESALRLAATDVALPVADGEDTQPARRWIPEPEPVIPLDESKTQAYREPEFEIALEPPPAAPSEDLPEAAETQQELSILDLPADDKAMPAATAAVAPSLSKALGSDPVLTDTDSPSFEIMLEPLPDEEVELSSALPKMQARDPQATIAEATIEPELEIAPELGTVSATEIAVDEDEIVTESNASASREPAIEIGEAPESVPDEEHRIEQSALPVVEAEVPDFDLQSMLGNEPPSTAEPLQAVAFLQEEASAPSLGDSAERESPEQEMAFSLDRGLREVAPPASVTVLIEPEVSGEDKDEEHLVTPEPQDAGLATVELTSAMAAPREARVTPTKEINEAVWAEPEPPAVEDTPQLSAEAAPMELSPAELGWGANTRGTDLAVSPEPPTAFEAVAVATVPAVEDTMEGAVGTGEPASEARQQDPVPAHATAARAEDPVTAAVAGATEAAVAAEPAAPPVSDKAQSMNLPLGDLDSLTGVLAEQLADRVLLRLKTPLVQEIKKILSGK